MVNNFQEQWPPRFRHARDRSDNVVVDEFTQLFRWYSRLHIRVKHFQEIPEFLLLGFLAELLKRQQRVPILLQIVYEGHRIQAQVRAGKFITRAVTFNFAALNLVYARAAKWLGGFARVATVP